MQLVGLCSVVTVRGGICSGPSEIPTGFQGEYQSATEGYLHATEKGYVAHSPQDRTCPSHR